MNLDINLKFSNNTNTIEFGTVDNQIHMVQLQS